MASYLEHMALKVADLDWHIQFFEKVFNMPVRMSLGEAPHRKVWLHAGLQLNEDTEFQNVEGRADHLGIMPTDYEETIERAYQVEGVTEHPMGHNWIILPSGMVIEIVKPNPQVVQDIIDMKPWPEE